MPARSIGEQGPFNIFEVQSPKLPYTPLFILRTNRLRKKLNSRLH